jgi:tRNA(Phe) wybutosine-synthesizing methylase Tyw3
MIQNMNQNVQKYVNQTKVQKYKALIEQKYAAKLDKFSQEKLQKINEKIDTLIEKIANSTKYSETKKETYINLLLALKASILDRLEDNTDVVDSLLGE